MSDRFRATLKKVRGERMRSWSDTVPDVLHFAGGGAATVVCAILLPFDTASVVGVGASIVLFVYLLPGAVRGCFEEAEDA